MYQVFVVEDELLIRQNIRKMVEGLGGPFVFCGEASDGEMALSIMQDVMPDILLTDIRMPFLDGFELIRLARAMMPWLKVIIISGFDDFEYARKAISLGVNSYLLKPVKSADLMEEMHKLAAEIESSKRSPVLPEGYNEAEVGMALRQHYLQQLLYGHADTGMLIDKARALKMDIMRSCYRTVLFYFDAGENERNSLHGRMLQILNGQGIRLYYFSQPEQVTVLFFENDEEALSERVYRFVSIVRHEMKDVCTAVTCVTAVSVQRLSQVGDAYRNAADLLGRVRLVAPGTVTDAGDPSQLVADYMNFDTPFGEGFRARLMSIQPEEAEQLLDSILQGPNREQFGSVLMRYYALLEIMKVTVKMIASVTPGADERDIAAGLSEEFEITAAAGSAAQFRSLALELMLRAVNAKRDNALYQKHYHVISRAEEYIARSFCDPNLTLNTVAAHVGMSAAHFSAVFSQTLGKSFIAYLTACRVEKARELLENTDMKLADIAMEIGYNEPSYFSHVFRKTVGVTPKDYRAEMSRQNTNPGGKE